MSLDDGSTDKSHVSHHDKQIIISVS